MIYNPTSPLTDSLLKEGCIAANLLEHAREMECKANLYRQHKDIIKSKSFRKDEIIENLTKENESLKTVMALLQNDLVKSTEQRDNLILQLKDANAHLDQYTTKHRENIWTPRRGI
jgi:cell division protein FtsB